MGNSEVGHNAFGAGRVIEQGASLVDQAIGSGALFEGQSWKRLMGCKTLHLIGLVSDGNVHSHISHLRALIQGAHRDGMTKIRVHALTDGRDVSERSALTWIEPLEAELAALPDAKIASGGGRMLLTMDRYEADWSMVERGWRCHVQGEGRPFPSASIAIRTFYAEDPKVTDQYLPAFVVENTDGTVGRIEEGDGVIFFNFRGDRAIEISRAFEEEDFSYFDRGVRPGVFFAGMMQYDGDLKIPKNFLVNPPVIDRTVGGYLAEAGRHSFVISETQKYGHVTYFFNGNRSGRIDEEKEYYEEIFSDRIPFDQAPEMKAERITDAAIGALRSGKFDHIRLNLANGDMVGHTGNFEATVTAVECVDHCVGRLWAACQELGAVLLVTADHGNADEMVELDKKGAPILVDGHSKPKSSHSLNPVPFYLWDPGQRWQLADVPDAGIASIGGTLLLLAGLDLPEGYAPTLVEHAAAS
jgi:2,3-bisphosphoglycerate-independent phosphoglycerate mutase